MRTKENRGIHNLKDGLDGDVCGFDIAARNGEGKLDESDSYYDESDPKNKAA